jgi:putative flippase GtrA
MVLNRLRSARALLWGRYTAASVIAGVISELAFLAAYGLGALPMIASVFAFIAGAVPNYLLNRYWAWQRRGRADRTRELLPYVVIVTVTAVTAAAVTTVADAWLRDRIESHIWQVLLVGAVFLATYGIMFVLKFVLFNRYVFAAGRPSGAAHTPATTSRS